MRKILTCLAHLGALSMATPLYAKPISYTQFSIPCPTSFTTWVSSVQSSHGFAPDHGEDHQCSVIVKRESFDNKTLLTAELETLVHASPTHPLTLTQTLWMSPNGVLWGTKLLLTPADSRVTNHSLGTKATSHGLRESSGGEPTKDHIAQAYKVSQPFLLGDIVLAVAKELTNSKVHSGKEFKSWDPESTSAWSASLTNLHVQRQIKEVFEDLDRGNNPFQFGNEYRVSNWAAKDVLNPKLALNLRALTCVLSPEKKKSLVAPLWEATRDVVLVGHVLQMSIEDVITGIADKVSVPTF